MGPGCTPHIGPIMVPYRLLAGFIQVCVNTRACALRDTLPLKVLSHTWAYSTYVY